MKKLIKVLFIAILFVSLASCGGESTSNDSTIKSSLVGFSEIETSFEAKTTEFAIDQIDVEKVRFVKMDLDGLRFSSEISDVNSEAIDLFISNTGKATFTSDEEYAEVASRVSGFKRVSVGILLIGEAKYDASFYYTNEENYELKGILFINKPKELSFINDNKIAIRVKGRQ